MVHTRANTHTVFTTSAVGPRLKPSLLAPHVPALTLFIRGEAAGFIERSELYQSLADPAPRGRCHFYPACGPLAEGCSLAPAPVPACFPRPGPLGMSSAPHPFICKGSFHAPCSVESLPPKPMVVSPYSDPSSLSQGITGERGGNTGTRAPSQTPWVCILARSPGSSCAHWSAPAPLLSWGLSLEVTV